MQLETHQVIVSKIEKLNKVSHQESNPRYHHTATLTHAIQ